MKQRSLRSDGLLLLASTIWGFAFVAQRVGMEHVGPFTYNGLRFALGSLVVLPFALGVRARATKQRPDPGPSRAAPRALALVGLVLFGAVSLQQSGLLYTTAGKAGFITGLYVVMVPLLGIFLRQPVTRGAWLGVILAACGLYLLSISSGFSIQPGDALVLLGACLWAIHVQLIDRLTVTIPPPVIALTQFTICSILCLLVAAALEPWSLAAVRAAAWPILYGGALSVGIAYTLQVVGQKHAPASHAAIILSLEAVFAAVGGGIILGERFGTRETFGCALMLCGMLASQLSPAPSNREPSPPQSAT